MKFRKLILCMFVGILLLNFSNISAYAAEEEITNLELEDNVEGITNDLEQEEVAEDIATDLLPEETTEEIVLDSDQELTEEEIISYSEQEANEDDTTDASEQETQEVSLEEEDTDQEESKETPQDENQDVEKYTKAQLRLLSALIYCESQGESYTGKLAVGIVVMNRVKSGRFPDTLKGVIYQKHQFSPANNGSLKRALGEYDEGNFTSAAEKECIKAAKAALSGTKSITVNGKKKNFSKYLFFSCWLRGYTYEIGNHQFK